MSTTSRPTPVRKVVYPDSDGMPMADNTEQLRWIVILFGNLAALFRKRPDVFVGANLFWYVEERRNDLCKAPDVLVVFGRPRGDRSCYKQWEEEDVPLTVVFEVLTPSNSVPEMIRKHTFYDENGVEEYYIYDPEKTSLFAYVRGVETLVAVRKLQGFQSPRLGISFDLSGPEMVVYGPDGQRFLTFEELRAERERERRDRIDAQQEVKDAQQRQARMAELSRKARRQQASPEELQELERLEDEASS